MLDAAILFILPFAMAVAAFTDTMAMTIPNRIPALLCLSFFVVAPLAGLPAIALGWHLLAGLVVLLVCFALFALNVMGGGDAKLLAASAIWYGWSGHLVEYLGLVGIFGGVLAIAVILIRAWQNALIALPVPIPAHFFDRKAGIPYGIAIGLAALVTFPETELAAAAIVRLS